MSTSFAQFLDEKRAIAAREAWIEMTIDMLEDRFTGHVTPAHRMLVLCATPEQIRDVARMLVTQNPDLTIDQALSPAKQPERTPPDSGAICLADVMALMKSKE